MSKKRQMKSKKFTTRLLEKIRDLLGHSLL